MTGEKAQKDFDKLIEENGFTYATTTDLGHRIYHREWCRKVQVAWQGEQEDRLEVRIMLSYGYPLVVVVKRNGREDPKFIRDYSSPKRAMNAIREIVRWTGFDW